MKLCIVFLMCVLHNVYGAINRVDPLVKIDQGLIKGHKSVEGYSSFLGIPYAQVDLENPFGPSLPAPDFGSEIFHAYNGTIQCPQNGYYAPRANMTFVNSLDCLRLNVYVPHTASATNLLPVLVYIHGGYFFFGSGARYNPQSLLKRDIIVATLNYRLGAYGFMCLDDPSVTGNQGLKDQYSALRWVRDNIEAFGGNPYSITLVGHSAGSTSALLQLYSAKEKIFHKIIAQSGTPLSNEMFFNGDLDAAIKLANHLGLNTDNTSLALSFLSKTSPDLVTGAARDLDLALAPCKEKSYSGVENFVTSDPFALSNPKKIKNMPVMTGHTSMEFIGGLGFYNKQYFNNPFLNKIKKHFDLNDDQIAEAEEIVRHFYIGDSSPSEEYVSEIEMFDSDYVFNHPCLRTVNNLLKENANPIYEYMFDYSADRNSNGVMHSGELDFLFNNGGTEKLNENDKLISDRITTMWANFVKYGNPTPNPTKLLPVTWEPVNDTFRPYYIIDVDMRNEHRIFKERMAFWDLFYSIYGKYNNLSRDSKKP